ncbi:MAG TPA: type II secretion system F family protein [Acidobacteriota bacterium]|nr:type II secretion system F family protein [Acidobacteriota bacterium]
MIIQWIALALIFMSVFWLVLTVSRVIAEWPARRRLEQRLSGMREELGDDTQEAVEALLRRQDHSGWVGKIAGLAELREKTALYIQQAGLEIRPSNLMGVSVLCGLAAIAFFFLLPLPPLAAPFVAAGACAIPFVYVSVRRSKRFHAFEQIFPEAIAMLSRAVRAGYAFSSALRLISTEMPDPLAKEFRITFEQQNLGMPLDEALDNLQRRMPLPDVAIFTTLLSIQLETGGNLAEMLDNLATVMRERFKLLRQVQVFTAEGRMSMYILCGLPPVAAVLFSIMSPAYMSRLFTDPMGHQMIAGAIILQVIGYLVIRRMIQIEV